MCENIKEMFTAQCHCEHSSWWVRVRLCVGLCILHKNKTLHHSDISIFPLIYNRNTLVFPFCFFELSCPASENIPVNSNHQGWIFQAWVALLDYLYIEVIMRNDLSAGSTLWHWGPRDIFNPLSAKRLSFFLKSWNLIWTLTGDGMLYLLRGLHASHGLSKL